MNIKRDSNDFWHYTKFFVRSTMSLTSLIYLKVKSCDTQKKSLKYLVIDNRCILNFL